MSQYWNIQAVYRLLWHSRQLHPPYLRPWLTTARICTWLSNWDINTPPFPPSIVSFLTQQQIFKPHFWYYDSLLCLPRQTIASTSDLPQTFLEIPTLLNIENAAASRLPYWTRYVTTSQFPHLHTRPAPNFLRNPYPTEYWKCYSLQTPLLDTMCRNTPVSLQTPLLDTTCHNIPVSQIEHIYATISSIQYPIFQKFSQLNILYCNIQTTISIF